MDVITIDIETPLCGTCQHWQGARLNEMGNWIRCLKQGDGICKQRQLEKRSVLETIQPCHGGENCPDWMKLERSPVLGSVV